MPTSISIERAEIRLVGKLVVRGRFVPGDEDRYSHALLNFLSKGHREYEIDLSDLERIGRAYVDATVVFARMAKAEGRKVVLLASRMVAREFRLAGFDSFGRIRVVKN